MRQLILLMGYICALHGVPALAADLDIKTVNDYESEFEIDGSRIRIEIRDPVLRQKRDMLLAWVLYSTKTVHQYYGRFPVDTVNINLQVSAGQAVRFGQAFGGSSPALHIVVGEHINPKMLRQDWILGASAMQVFESADRATGVQDLVPLYQKMKADPFPVDLDDLWAKLGVSLQNDKIVFDDDAPMAHIRQQLLKS